MSRIANQPIQIPPGVDVNIKGQLVEVRRLNGDILSREVHPQVRAEMRDGEIFIRALTEEDQAMAGTTRSLINNLITGVYVGFTKSLELVGVGYRASVKDRVLNLTLGFSHPVSLDIPDTVEIETPSQTQIIVKGFNKQQVGQIAADIRAIRSPEPYKGKGVRYSNEIVIRKQAKKA